MRWGFCVLAAALCAACYDPKVPVGLKCATGSTPCPSGQMCGADNLCHLSLTPDGGLSADTGTLTDAGVQPDTGVMRDTGVTVDTGVPIDTGVPDDSGLPYSGSLFVGELQVYGGPLIAVVGPYWSTPAQRMVGLKVGDPSAATGCVGYSFDATSPYSPASGNAGTVSLTGHGCVANDGGAPCPPSTITCSRDGTGAYVCAGLGPVSDFLPDTSTPLHLVATGGSNVPAFDLMVPSAALSRVDMATQNAVVGTQKWDGTQALTINYQTSDSGAVGSVVRIEASDGPISAAVPFAEPATSTRYATLTCSAFGGGAVTVSAADIMTTFHDILPTATSVRVTASRVRALLPSSPGNPTTAIAIGQGNMMFDTMPRIP